MDVDTDSKNNLPQNITIAGREIMILTHSRKAILYMIGHRIHVGSPFFGGTTQVSCEDIISSVCQPPDTTVYGSTAEDNTDPNERIRVFVNKEEAYTRIKSNKSGKVAFTRHGNPLVTVEVIEDTLKGWTSTALPIEQSTTGFSIPFPDATDLEFKTAEFKGPYFNPVRFTQYRCVIL